MTMKPGRYRHFKGGEYRVQGVARHSETGESLVVYTPLYGEGGLWVRPLAMFEERVLRDGMSRPRFEYLGPD
ncbi:MAG: DUF1653 domain-containing protein [Halieaceae bacterium]|nr:DUF1653 domain-containing protein [Halieaceae bacterium]